MSNPLGKVVTRNSGRRLVISDVHGCQKTLERLITNLHLKKDDQLFLLGDYVNKGPSSKAVVDYVIGLQDTCNLFPLLGNHDLMVLNYLKEGSAAIRERLTEVSNTDFFELKEKEKQKYLNFFSGLHHYFILDNFIIVHAGFDFNLANPFLGTEAMINIREFYYDSSKAQGKTVVHGHFPYTLNYIRTQIEEKNKVLPLDNGCVYADREGQGNLLCFNVDTDELIVQPNTD